MFKPFLDYDKRMSQRIGDLLRDKGYVEPPEIKQIKEFVKQEIGLMPKVSITKESYVITVTSAAAAGALRSSLFKLQKKIENNKRLIIRIG